MVEMRELSEEEKKISLKVIAGRKAELCHVELMVEYNDFMLDKMLESNYLEKRRAFKRQTDDLKAEANELKNIISTTQKQIDEGVEVMVEVDGDVPGMVA